MAVPSAQILQRFVDGTGHPAGTLEKVLRLLGPLREIPGSASGRSSRPQWSNGGIPLSRFVRSLRPTPVVQAPPFGVPQIFAPNAFGAIFPE